MKSKLELTTWDDDRIARLKARYADGCTPSEIANEFGLSRNAVIGKLHRLGLVPPKNPAKPKPNGGNFRYRSATKPSGPKLPEGLPLPPDCKPVHLLDATVDQCRYPIGEGRDMMFCGASVIDATCSWCQYHWRICKTRFHA